LSLHWSPNYHCNCCFLNLMFAQKGTEHLPFEHKFACELAFSKSFLHLGHSPFDFLLHCLLWLISLLVLLHPFSRHLLSLHWAVCSKTLVSSIFSFSASISESALRFNWRGSVCSFKILASSETWLQLLNFHHQRTNIF